MFEIKKLLNTDYNLGVKLEYLVESDYKYKITGTEQDIDYFSKTNHQINFEYLKDNFYGKEIELNLSGIKINGKVELPIDKYLKELSTINNKVKILIEKSGEPIKILNFDDLRKEWVSKKVELTNKYFTDNTMLSLIELTDLGYKNDISFKQNFFNNLVYKLLFFDGYNKTYVTNNIKKGKFEIKNYISNITLPIVTEICMKNYDMSKNMLEIVIKGHLRDGIFNNYKFNEMFNFNKSQKLKSELEIVYYFEITTGYLLKCDCSIISKNENYFRENKIKIIRKGTEENERI